MRFCPTELMSMKDVIEWVAWNLASERRKYRYHFRPKALEYGRTNYYLSHTVRESSWSGRSSREVDWEWTRLADSLGERLEWPASDMTGGRIPQTAVGVLRILGSARDLAVAENRARELERKWATRARG